MTITAVIGSRSIKNVSDNTFDALRLEAVVSGGAVGVDSSVEDYCKRKGLPFHKHLPDYTKHGKKAPLIRNETIIDDSDEVVALWDGISTGTMHAVRYARKQGKKVRLYKLTLARDKWLLMD